MQTDKKKHVLSTRRRSCKIVIVVKAGEDTNRYGGPADEHLNDLPTLSTL
jgi:hypothetical protein